MRGIHGPSLGERRVPYGRDHERHFPDRGRDFHLDWNALKGARDLGNAQPLRDLEHDPEKCAAVFRKDHAQTIT
jgi:hypothetical protein